MKIRASLVLFVLVFFSRAQAFDLYSNGPFLPNTDQGVAFAGQSGDPEVLTVSNSFALEYDSTIETVSLGIGVSGDFAPQSFYWNIGSTAFSTTMGGTVFVFSSEKVGEDEFGNANFAVSFSLSGLPLSAGTYWLTLSQGLSTNPVDGQNQLFWLQSTGGPSISFQQENSDTPQSVSPGSFTLSGVPEPSTYILFAVGGFLLLVGLRRRQDAR